MNLITIPNTSMVMNPHLIVSMKRRGDSTQITSADGCSTTVDVDYNEMIQKWLGALNGPNSSQVIE